MGYCNPSKKYAALDARKYYSIRSLLGNDWAMFYVLLGGRAAGKSYATLRFCVDQFVHKGRPFYWMRLTDAEAKKILANNAMTLIDPDIRRDFNLETEVKGNIVYHVTRDEAGRVKERKMMCRILSLSTFYGDKGNGYYDKDFLKDGNMYYNIVLDEMNKDKIARRTISDLLYAFTNQIENIIRTTKEKVRIIMIGNTIEECSELMVGFNFIPEEFGRYKIKKKRLVIDYIPPTAAYIEERTGSAADILTPTASTFTNMVEVNTSHIWLLKKNVPTSIIKFGDDKSKWYTVWDSFVIDKYKGEKISHVIQMYPYRHEPYRKEDVDWVIKMVLGDFFMYSNLLIQKKFTQDVAMKKPMG